MKIKAVVFWALFTVLLASGPGHKLVLAQVLPVNKPGEEPEKGIEEDEDVIKINFPEMDLESVLKNFSALTGKSFILDQLPKGQIRTIGPIGPVEVPRERAFDLFVLIMQLNGYSVVPTSLPDVYKVVRSAESIKENVPLYPPGAKPHTNEQMIIRFIPLQHITASDIQAPLSQLSSKDGGQVIAYAPTNLLIVFDTALNIERMQKLIRILDVPSPEPEIEIVQLRYAQAQEISGIIGQIFESSSSAPAARTASTRPARRPRGRRGTPTPAPQTTTAGQSPDNAPKIIPVERTNSLIIIAEPDVIDAIKDLVARLDIDVGSAGTIHVYYVQNAEASDLASTLSGLAGKSTQNAIPTAAALQQQQPTGRRTRTRPTAATPATSGSSSQSSSITGVLGGEITITSDEATNSLIIVASPQEYEVLKRVIEKLDIPRRQVFVEAVLLEITYNENADWGVSAHGASPIDNNGVVVAGTSFSDVSSISLLSSLSSGTLALPSGITVGALGQPVDISGTGTEVPSAGLIVRMLASNNNVNVLSTPTLLTTDNEEASIEVGQKIPVPTGQTVSTGGFSNVSISRESVGIKLRITPQINESDNIRLEIFTEISGAVQNSNLGIDVNQLGVTTSIKTAETTVIVKDSQTIVIGGLMEDRQNESSSRVPFLGDIPVLGWLFKSGSQGKSKTNLIILLTPHIVRSDNDAEFVKQKLQKDYDNLMEENLGDQKPDWDRYFESQLKQNQEDRGTVIDMRTGEPNIVNEPDWGWQPETPGVMIEEGDTAAKPGQRSATTRDMPEGESP